MAIDIPFGGAGASGGSPFLIPAPPTPLTDIGFISTVADTIAHKGVLINNVEFPMSGIGNFEGKLENTTIWTVTPANIDALVDNYMGSGRACWYDSINDRLYVFGVDTSTNPDTIYTAYITLETGAVTNVGNAQLATDIISIITEREVLIQRSAIDSGDFVIQTTDRTVTINSGTGAIISDVAADSIISGFTGTYSTQDGAVFLERIQAGTGNYILLTRNRKLSSIPSPANYFSVTSPIATIDAIRWGTEVHLMSSAANDYFYRAFDQVEFDEWLQKLADVGGLA